MLSSFFENQNNLSPIYLTLTIILFLLIYLAIMRLLRRYGRNPKYLIPEDSVKKVSAPLFLILFSLIIRMESLRELLGLQDFTYGFRKLSTLLLLFSLTWLIIRALKMVKQLILDRQDVEAEDNYKARSIYTQFNILERVIIFVVILLAIAAALMSFEGIRDVGVSIFASAGVAGIIIGFSAQKMIGTLLAGIQIAITQPIKLDDVVIVEGEWGRIEEITLTYVVLKIWDKRRLVIPTTYFIEKPFQNWTKTSADILGAVYLYLDYRVPADALRQELDRILKGTDQWDGEVGNIQFTDSKADYVEVRALMSAKDSGKAWELRVMVREKLIAFLQQNYPESLVHSRVYLKKEEASKNTAL
ncbi:MAG: mechanosensitive ion channel domain-containing protein [Bacteroidota bacterium]